MTDYQGKVFSPYYPEPYPKNMDCDIRINVADAHVHLALFFSKFSVESSAACANDYVQIDSATKLCGKALPPPYFKQTNTLDIKFHSNQVVEGLL